MSMYVPSTDIIREMILSYARRAGDFRSVEWTDNDDSFIVRFSTQRDRLYSFEWTMHSSCCRGRCELVVMPDRSPVGPTLFAKEGCVTPLLVSKQFESLMRIVGEHYALGGDGILLSALAKATSGPLPHRMAHAYCQVLPISPSPSVYVAYERDMDQYEPDYAMGYAATLRALDVLLEHVTWGVDDVEDMRYWFEENYVARRDIFL